MLSAREHHYLIARDAAFSVGLSNPFAVWHPTSRIFSGSLTLSYLIIGQFSTQFSWSLLLGHECPKTGRARAKTSLNFFFCTTAIFSLLPTLCVVPTTVCLPSLLALCLLLSDFHCRFFCTSSRFFFLLLQPPITTTIDNTSSSPQVNRQHRHNGTIAPFFDLDDIIIVITLLALLSAY